MYRVLVGIPTYKRPALLRKCLAELGRSYLPDGSGEIRVFVADNDKEGTAGLVQSQFPLTSQIVPERGLSAARNSILDHARETGAQFVAMLDDDTMPSQFWLSALLMQQEETGADVVGCPVQYLFDHKVPTKIKNAFWVDRRPDGPTDIIAGICGVLVSCHLLGKLDWPRFNSEFGLTGGEDKDWFQRLKTGGATFAFASHATVFEPVPPERARGLWILKRGFRIGNDDIRIPHEPLPRSLRKAAMWIAMIPLAVLPIYRTQYRLVSNFGRGLGRFAALFGLTYREYAD